MRTLIIGVNLNPALWLSTFVKQKKYTIVLFVLERRVHYTAKRVCFVKDLKGIVVGRWLLAAVDNLLD